MCEEYTEYQKRNAGFLDETLDIKLCSTSDDYSTEAYNANNVTYIGLYSCGFMWSNLKHHHDTNFKSSKAQRDIENETKLFVNAYRSGVKFNEPVTKLLLEQYAEYLTHKDIPEVITKSINTRIKVLSESQTTFGVGVEIFKLCIARELGLHDVDVKKLRIFAENAIAKIQKHIIEVWEEEKGCINQALKFDYIKKQLNDISLKNSQEKDEVYVRDVKSIIEDVSKHLSKYFSDGVTVSSPSVQIKYDVNMPIGWYCNGTYFLNLGNEKWNSITEAIVKHESNPGHHLDRFRSGFTSVKEGWGLYSESLIETYDDTNPRRTRFLNKIGTMFSELWRATRVLLNVLIHTNEIGQEEAEVILTKYTTLSEGNVKMEILRYASCPARDMSYYIGAYTIREYWKLYSSTLSNALLRYLLPQFVSEPDIKLYHDIVLECTSLQDIQRRCFLSVSPEELLNIT